MLFTPSVLAPGEARTARRLTAPEPDHKTLEGTLFQPAITVHVVAVACCN